jgi:hypothetical protein
VTGNITDMLWSLRQTGVAELYLPNQGIGARASNPLPQPEEEVGEEGDEGGGGVGDAGVEAEATP